MGGVKRQAEDLVSQAIAEAGGVRRSNAIKRLKRRQPSPIPVPSSAINEIPLTIGLELEFVLAVKSDLPDGYKHLLSDESTDANDDEFDPSDTLGKILAKCKLPYGVPLGGSVPEEWSAMLDDSIDTTDFYDNDYQKAHLLLPTHVTKGEGDEWEVFGVELASRVLQAPPTKPEGHYPFSSDPNMQEIQRYLEAVKGAHQPWSAYTNDTTGFHVHVGADPKFTTRKDEQIPFPILQHLVYIIIQFEPIITSLFPVSRRAWTSTNEHIESNLMGLRLSRHICSKRPLPVVEKIQDIIFGENMDEEKLARLMHIALRSHRSDDETHSKFVNFIRLRQNRRYGEPSPPGESEAVPRTIEFRQHEGTLDFEDVWRWVHFVVSLIRAAERKHHQSKPGTPASPKTPKTEAQRLEQHLQLPFPAKQGKKYRVKCEAQAAEFTRFFDLLDFDRQTREYWCARYAKFNPGETIEEKTDDWTLGHGVKSELCPMCNLEASGLSEEKERRRYEAEQRLEQERLTVLGTL